MAEQQLDPTSTISASSTRRRRPRTCSRVGWLLLFFGLIAWGACYLWTFTPGARRLVAGAGPRGRRRAARASNLLATIAFTAIPTDGGDRPRPRAAPEGGRSRLRDEPRRSPTSSSARTLCVALAAHRDLLLLAQAQGHGGAGRSTGCWRMTTSGRFQRWRRLAGAAQALVWLGLPFVLVGGESALRLDVPAGRLHAFGASFAIDEAFVVLAATLLVTAAFLLVTLLYGRVWCGWSCPQTVLGDLTRWVEPGPRSGGAARGARSGRRGVAPAAGLRGRRARLRVVAASLLWYFVSAARVLPRGSRRARSGPVLGWSWARARGGRCSLDLAFRAGDVLRDGLPVREAAGRPLRPAHARGRLRRGAATTDCVDCGACVRVCPTGIDIRDGLQMECIACAACVDACTPIMAKLRRRAGPRRLLLRRARHAPRGRCAPGRRSRSRARPPPRSRSSSPSSPGARCST